VNRIPGFVPGEQKRCRVADRTLSQGRPAIDLDLAPDVVAAMRRDLAAVAGRTVGAIRQEVPSYADPFRGEMGRTIEQAVQLALDGFLGIASGDTVAGATSFEPVSDAAYALGRGEARAGRSMDALLSAYRVGARVAWRDMSEAGVRAGLPAQTVARFAELVFAYIDELSASSAAGHADELATSGRVRQRYLERLTQGLLRGAPADALEAAAERADWKPPAVLAAVVLPDERARRALTQVDNGTLQPAEQVPGLEDRPDLTVLLVPVAGARSRVGLLRRLHGSDAVVGPARPWHDVRSSYERALRVVRLELAPTSAAPLDTEAHLADLILNADVQARADLRLQVLAPLEELRPAAAAKLKETLRSWLLHHGRREEVAAELFVHPQTVRYRMQQLRDLYGDKLEDPAWVLGLTLALA
jgi:PucR C-terminal helix-turn-helix domain